MCCCDGRGHCGDNTFGFRGCCGRGFRRRSFFDFDREFEFRRSPFFDFDRDEFRRCRCFDFDRNECGRRRFDFDRGEFGRRFDFDRDNNMWSDY